MICDGFMVSVGRISGYKYGFFNNDNIIKKVE